MHQSNRIAIFVRLRTRHPGNRNGDVGRACVQHARRHRFNHRSADCRMLGDQILADVKDGRLLLLGIDDEASVKPLTRAWSVGE